MKKVTLKQQLRRSGSHKRESTELAHVADMLASAKPDGLSNSARERILGIPGLGERRSPVFKYSFAGSMAVFVIMATTVAVAQSAQPGSALYGIKRGTEEVRTIVQPSYTEDLVETRKEEVESLKQKDAPQEEVKRAEKDYYKALERARNKFREPSNTPQQKDQNRWRTWRWRRANQNRDSHETPSGQSQEDTIESQQP